MKIAVVGAGGVGGYFGARLARAGLSVTLVARGAHLAAIRERGLTIRSAVHGDFTVRLPATDDPSAVGPVNLVLFCVKSTDTETAARQIAPMIGGETTVLSLQNGVDNEARIEAVLGAAGRGRVMGGVAYIGAALGEPGEVVHTSEGRIAVGELSGGVSARARRIERLFADAGVPCQVAADITWVLWRKLLWNSAFNALTTIGRTTVDRVLALPEAVAVATAAMREVAAVARARGIELGASAVDDALAFSRTLGAVKTSMLQDLERGKPLEREALNGVVIRYGREAGVPTPVQETLFGALALLDPAAAPGRG